VATSTITGTVTDPTGVAVSGAVVVCTLMPTGGFRTADGSEVARAVSTTTNASGVYSFALERNSGISPANTYYQIEERIPAANGGTKVWNISVGASNQTTYASLVTPLAAQTATYLDQASADARYQALGGLSSSNPTASAVADAAAAGSSTSASRADHKHGREAFASPVATAPTGNSAGTATTVPHSDHVHQGTGTLSGGYAPATANQGSITTEVDLTSLTVTVTTVAGRRYKITGKANFQSTVADDRVDLRIYQDGTMINDADTALRVANSDQTCMAVAVVAPSAASHTYKLTAVRLSGTGTLTMACGATFPAFILVEDIGT
jgi:hypothetical protein